MRKVKYVGKYYQDAGEKLNEDSCLVLREKGIIFIIVADGVGGLDKGELASEYLISSMREWIKKYTDKMESITTDDIKNHLHDQIMKMHESLKDLSDEKNISVGSTFTGAVIKGNTYVIAHIGDSRAYLYSNGETKLLTKDQTLYQREADKGADLSSEEMKAKAHVLLQCIGYGKIIPQYYEGILPDEYSILLCSDGLCNTLKAADFNRELSKDTELEEQLKELTRTARERGETDNITSVCVKKILL